MVAGAEDAIMIACFLFFSHVDNPCLSLIPVDTPMLVLIRLLF